MRKGDISGKDVKEEKRCRREMARCGGMNGRFRRWVRVKATVREKKLNTISVKGLVKEVVRKHEE